jgi:hypothetical protein
MTERHDKRIADAIQKGSTGEKLERYKKIVGAELDALIGGKAPETAKPVDLYGSNRLRFMASFGNPKGLQDELAQRGYKNAQYSPNGDIVAQTQKGTWVRDADKFKESVPKALASLGGYAPEMFALASTAPTGPGAMLGGATGYAAKRAIGGMYGTYVPDDILAPTTEMLTSSLLAGAGQKLIAEPLAKGITKAAPYVEKLAKPVRDWLAENIHKLTVFDSPEAVARMVQRPYQMAEALRMKPEEILDVAQGAAAERRLLSGEMAGKIRKAKQPLLQQTEVSLPTQYARSASYGELTPMAYGPSTQGIGALTPKAAQAQKALIKRYFSTPVKDEQGKVIAELPQQTVHNLMKAYEEVNARINNWDAQNQARMIAGEGAAVADTVEVKLLKNLRGRIQEILKGHSTDYAKALEEYKALVEHTNLLDILERPLSREATITGAFGPNKELLRQAISKAFPETAPKVLDVGAAKLIQEQSPLFGMTRYAIPTMAGLGMAGTGLMLGGKNQASLPLMLTGTALTGLTNPLLQRQAVLGLGKLMRKPFWQSLAGKAKYAAPYVGRSIYEDLQGR